MDEINDEKKKRVEEELRRIQDKFGEKVAHLCRKLFQDILEYDGLLYKTLTENFAKTKSIGEFLEAMMLVSERYYTFNWAEIPRTVEEEFAAYIYELAKPSMQTKSLLDTGKTPEELLDEEGYVLYECHTEEEIQAFKKYYEPDEELCTFAGGRLKTCHVFFIVKKDVDKIKREDFPSPEREDEYSLSVLSIQFTRGKNNMVSIKSRYNHSVALPDSVHLNDLEKLKVGLTTAFAKKYRLNISIEHSDLLPLAKGDDGKYYPVNAKIYQGNCWKKGIKDKSIIFCPENIIIEDGKIIDTYVKNKERYIVFDYFILDLSEKKITTYNGIKDSFIDGLQNIKKIDISKDKQGNKTIVLSFDEGKTATIVIDKRNTMLSYKNDNLEVIGDSFLKECVWIREVDIPNVKEIGDSFLEISYLLTKLNAPNVEIMGHYALYDSRIPELHLPKLKEVGDEFCSQNQKLLVIDCPELKYATASFARESTELIIINTPKLEKDTNEPTRDLLPLIGNNLIKEYLEEIRAVKQKEGRLK